MPVVVTGAAGFLGRALVDDLLGAGYAVIAVDRRPFPGPPGPAPALAGPAAGPYAPGTGVARAGGARAGATWPGDSGAGDSGAGGTWAGATGPGATRPGDSAVGDSGAGGAWAGGAWAGDSGRGDYGRGDSGAGDLGAGDSGMGDYGMGATGMSDSGTRADEVGATGMDADGVGGAWPGGTWAGGAWAGLVVVRADLLGGDPVVAAALRDADAVFHLAGRPGVRDGGAAADAARARDNVAATAAVLAGVPRDTPLVVTSSSSVYGGAAGRPSREDDPLRPLGGYALSKAAAERLCAERGGAVAVLRPFTVAGEGQRPDMALARWIAAVRSGRPIEVLGSPARTRDVTDVRDVVRALRTAAERGVTGLLNVGTGRPRTLGELAAAVCRALDAPAPLTVSPAAAVEPPDTWADTDRLERLLGFVPVTDLDVLVARQAAAAGALPTPALAG